LRERRKSSCTTSIGDWSSWLAI